ncbi:hypothetical protein EN871_18665 [bacterium M00.F.Ca.ET.228.01.1.1]|uniref:hypothetical protein n=1 Tax=Paraburkholderia phenoliruptrix TaxID=252970 RepID=UPI0010925780|nr:hypothetical protein [Paraburkholderia phenoliruptrix]TGP42940.1 hypothetical protein EN871_18665 [bacterium M00.F.Ca.ET.228.01.1.1]TGR99132.1 hypothetical protein EN834_21305 [bacterium M00.F.Ca.ET.191.01.1.1]TGU03443.1 hypothetical protein EN798_22125 [bacterium M00.F.Ca.ET.155.01.1.1]MBW0449515.1 hypothetical protein [Paraburkholderia phenoliruptrix]MBW9099169.1 hypothetical protein [Paraburkholderia phenoliruptrix]
MNQIATGCFVMHLPACFVVVRGWCRAPGDAMKEMARLPAKRLRTGKNTAKAAAQMRRARRPTGKLFL